MCLQAILRGNHPKQKLTLLERAVAAALRNEQCQSSRLVKTQDANITSINRNRKGKKVIKESKKQNTIITLTKNFAI